MPFTPDPLDTPLYEGKRFSRPPNYGVANAAYLSPQSRTSRAFTSYRFWITDYDKTLAAYYALIAGVDVALGTIREELQRQGFADNTVIIFTSDNGYNCGAHGFGDKVLPYEEASKSPLLIYDPRLPKGYAGKVSAAVTGNVDMTPTILALAGVPAPDNLDGRNLLPLLTNPGGQVRDFLSLFNFWGIESAQSMAVVTPEWKYIYWYYGGKDMTPVEELFHVGQDRFELELVTALYGPQLQTMRQYYDAQLDHINRHVFHDHGYKPYPTLFDRSIAWSQKEPLLKPQKEVPATERGKRGKRKVEPADE
jgi:arylsulfatase A-like enzyme